ncbi:Hypothetical protein CINCED_3A016308 [Cinara cedri]|uniref:Uncharacterized protein n=1 Tax=Cinara cedri TaxID=506608 RepID=A0A5E4M129_9HEMI|nr:Hypothetical protein CINCED_3A016308 [Cinara cedri]
MMVALRIITVCVLAVICGGADGAPAVTYDQRQHGEFNLQVDMDGVAIVLLPGSEFAQRSAIIGDKVHQIFGRRRNGAADNTSRSKHKKPVTCSTTTPVTPAPSEVPSYSELPSSSVSTTTQGYDDLVASLALSTQQGLDDLKPVSEPFNPPDLYNQTELVAAVQADDHDPYSVTPSTPDLTTQKVVSLETEDVTADPAAVTAANAVKTIDDFIDNITSTLNNSGIPLEDAKANVQPTNSVSNNFEENPISISSDVKTVEKATNDEPIQTGDTVDKPAIEKTAVKLVDKPKEANVVNITGVEPNFKAEEKQSEKTLENPTDEKPMETVEKSVQRDVAIVKITDTESKINDNKPNELVATKTLEKPIFEPLMTVKKTEDDKTAAAVSSTDQDSRKNPIEMIAMQTIENPSNGNAVESSAGITTSTKIVEIQEDKNAPRKPTVETIVSRTAPTLTEMVAVKTMENPATITTVKSVTSVKTVIKTGNTKTTSSHSSNGSTIMRKVGDRRPLPSMTLEVAPPKVV